jgi:ADP-ribose pyrophosphatase
MLIRFPNPNLRLHPVSAADDLQTIGKGRFLRLICEDGWEYAQRIGAHGVVAVLAITPQDELVLTEQYRLPVKRAVIDLPAGLAGDLPGAGDEELTIAARRELEEETGWTARTLRPLATLPSSPGLTSETVDLFLAEGTCRIGPGGGDDSEAIIVHLVPRPHIAAWLHEQLAAGMLVDPKVYAALWLVDQL